MDESRAQIDVRETKSRSLPKLWRRKSFRKGASLGPCCLFLQFQMFPHKLKSNKVILTLTDLDKLDNRNQTQALFAFSLFRVALSVDYGDLKPHLRGHDPAQPLHVSGLRLPDVTTSRFTPQSSTSLRSFFFIKPSMSDVLSGVCGPLLPRIVTQKCVRKKEKKEK